MTQNYWVVTYNLDGCPNQHIDQMLMQYDGNLVVYSTSNQPCWASGTFASHAKLKLWESGAEIQDADGRRVKELHTYGDGKKLCIWKPDTRVFNECDTTIICGQYAMRFQCDGHIAFLKHDPATGQWPPKVLLNVTGPYGKGGNLFKKNELTMEM